MNERATLQHDLLLLAALAALVFLPGLGSRDLWNPDEARYVEVAREMRTFGTYAVPHLNGRMYTEKPPLLFWLIDLSGFLFGGLNETTSRVPIALAAIGAVLLVYRIGERWFGRRAGWTAAAAFATCAKVLWQGRFGQIDMLLTCLVTLAVWFWTRGLTEDRPKLYPLFFVSAGLATLAKGPVGLLPPLLSILAFLALTRNWREMKRLRVGLGLLIWAGVMLCWLVPAGIAGGREYLEPILIRQNVTRYVTPWHHLQPWYYYLTVIPPEFFPWSFLLPTALFLGWKGLDGRERQGFLFALCWTVVTLVFFSLSPAKRTVYILTMYPAMALLVGAALDRLAADWPRDRKWLTVPLGLMAGFAVLLLAALPLLGRGRPEAVPLGGDSFLWRVTAALVPMVLGAVAAWWISRSGRVDRAVGSLAAGMAVTAVVAALFILPRFNVIKSTRTLSGVLVRTMGPGEPYGIYPRLDPTFLYYTGRFAENLDSESKLRAFVARPGRIWLLARRDELAKLAPPLPPMQEVARDADWEQGYLLLTRP
ncbi:MAG TPA: glycosyltransferase family 39 protein [Thermoanaerobaculia bacterium]|nr:glycosyltransferase family 39 protein [Thermoanaerobaculia bacterium]